MATITIEQYHACYDYGKRIFEGNLDVGMAAYYLEKEGMAHTSATIYVECVKAMLSGERYTGTVKEMATSHFLTEIYAEYGNEGLRKALKAVELHLEYQERYNNLQGIRNIYEDFKEILVE